MKDLDQIIADLSDLRKYRTELPNLYDDSELDVYEFRLLAHYKRVGTCTESTRTTAARCRMSTGKVSAARQSLKAKKLIAMTEVVIPGKGIGYSIAVNDVWLENFAKYSGYDIDTVTARLKAMRSPHERERSPHERERSPHETKNKPIKNKPIKKVGEKTPRPRDVTFDAIADVCGPGSDEQESWVKSNGGWIARVANNGARKYAPEKIREWFSVGGWYYRVRCKGMRDVARPTPETVQKLIAYAAAWDKANETPAMQTAEDVAAEMRRLNSYD